MHDSKFEEFDLDGVNVYREEPKRTSPENSWADVSMKHIDGLRTIRKIAEQTDENIHGVISVVQNAMVEDKGLEEGLKKDLPKIEESAERLARAALTKCEVETKLESDESAESPSNQQTKTKRKSDEKIHNQVMADLGSPIEPDYYRKGKIDLFESWYLTRPFNEFRAIMESIAERYLKRIKNNRLEDLDKVGYVIKRLREYEEREMEK